MRISITTTVMWWLIVMSARGFFVVPSSPRCGSLRAEKEPSVAAKGAWFAAELLGKLKGSSGAEASREAPPKTVDEAIKRVEADYLKEPPYFLSGGFDSALYAEDCEFADPFVSFKGRRRFEDNLANLAGGFITEASAKPLGDPVVTSDSYKQRFAVKLKLALPWRPLLAWPWGVEHVFGERDGNVVVVRHLESWDVSV